MASERSLRPTTGRPARVFATASTDRATGQTFDHIGYHRHRGGSLAPSGSDGRVALAIPGDDEHREVATGADALGWRTEREANTPAASPAGGPGPLAGLLRGGTTLGVLHYLLVVGAERGERDGVLFLLVLTLHVLHRLAYP